MAFEKPGFMHSESSTGTIIQYRVVVGSGAGLKMSTATPANARPLGVAQEGTTATGRRITFMASGITKVMASSGALARWAYVSPTSGAAASTSFLGGTVKATTAIQVSMGVALTSAAAGASQRLVSVLLFR